MQVVVNETTVCRILNLSINYVNIVTVLMLVIPHVSEARSHVRLSPPTKARHGHKLGKLRMHGRQELVFSCWACFRFIYNFCVRKLANVYIPVIAMEKFSLTMSTSPHAGEKTGSSVVGKACEFRLNTVLLSGFGIACSKQY